VVVDIEGCGDSVDCDERRQGDVAGLVGVSSELVLAPTGIAATGDCPGTAG